MPFTSDNPDEPEEIHESGFRGWEIFLLVVVIFLCLAVVFVLPLPH